MVGIINRSNFAKLVITLLVAVLITCIADVSLVKADDYNYTQTDVNAQEVINTIANSSTKLHVIDKADILTDREEKKLVEKCKKASKNCETDIVIITMETGKDYAEFDNYIRAILEQYYGYNGTGTDSEAIIYGIDMVSRADRIITSGKTRSDISQGTLDSIRENAEEELAEGDYYEGCVKFINGVEKQMNNSFLYEFTLYWPIKLIIAAVIALISVLVMMSSAKVKMTVSSNTYANKGFKMHRQEDRFINTTVTTRRIESSSSGGGSRSGGGGGNSGSSGGHF